MTEILSWLPTIPLAKDHYFLKWQKPLREIRPLHPEITEREKEFKQFLRQAEQPVRELEQRCQKEEELQGRELQASQAGNIIYYPQPLHDLMPVPVIPDRERIEAEERGLETGVFLQPKVRSRILAKWQKRGIVGEMMREHQIHRGGLSKKIDHLSEVYLRLQSLHPENSLLRYASIGKDGYLHINEELLYRERLPERDLEDDRQHYSEMGGRRENKMAVARYKLLLDCEISLLSRTRILEQGEVEIRNEGRYLSQ